MQCYYIFIYNPFWITINVILSICFKILKVFNFIFWYFYTISAQNTNFVKSMSTKLKYYVTDAFAFQIQIQLFLYENEVIKGEIYLFSLPYYTPFCKTKYIFPYFCKAFCVYINLFIFYSIFLNNKDQLNSFLSFLIHSLKWLLYCFLYIYYNDPA